MTDSMKLVTAQFEPWLSRLVSNIILLTISQETLGVGVDVDFMFQKLSKKPKRMVFNFTNVFAVQSPSRNS